MLLYFNPGHETAVLNASPYYMPPANVLQLQADLALLPAWYGSSEDCVFVRNEAEKAYISQLKKYFPNLPAAITENDLTTGCCPDVSFWGISPQAIHFFSELKEKHKTGIKIPAWKNEYNYLNSRKASKDCLEILIDQIPEISANLLPSFCNTLEEAEKLITGTGNNLLAKSPYSSSGRGLLWLPAGKLPGKEKEVLHGMLKKQGCISLEAVLDKETDFAMQFMTDEKGNVRFAGYSFFETNSKGAYLGNFLESRHTIEKMLAEKISFTLLEHVKQTLISILTNKYAPVYKGCIGVDMMIYNENGCYKLHPCLEINMRYNMGYLSARLQQNYLAQSVKGRFRIEYNGKEGNTYQKHTEISQQFPLQVKDGKIEQGYLSLCPVSANSKYHAYMLIM